MAAMISERQFTPQLAPLSRETSARLPVTQAQTAHNSDSVQLGGEHTCYNQQMAVQGNLKTMMTQIKMSQGTAATTINGNSGVGILLPTEPARLAQGPGLPTGAGTSPVTRVDAMGLQPLAPTNPLTHPTHLIPPTKGGRIFLPTSLPSMIEHNASPGLKSRMLRGKITTEKGPGVEVYKNLKGERTREELDTNCHGRTFLNGEYWLEPSQLDEFLLYEKYAPLRSIEPLQVGDKVVYSVPFDPSFHSATVTQISPSVLVTGESGADILPSTTTLEKAVYWRPETSVKIYRKY